MNLLIFISTSPNLKGIRCVKAASTIEKGQLIEECPTILIKSRELKDVEKTILGDYKYAWNQKFDCFVLGYMVLTNHSFTPNAVYMRDYKRKTMKYYALQRIAKDEEITINYNGDPKDMTPLEKEYTNFAR